MEGEQTPPTTTILPPEVQALLEKVGDDPADLPKIRRVFADNPRLRERLGHMARGAEITLLDAIAPRWLARKEAVCQEMEKLRSQLTATASSPLELLLVDRIVVCWLAVYHCEVDLVTRLRDRPDAHVAHQAAVKRLDRAHARFLSAVKALATVQKLQAKAPSAFDLLRLPVSETAKPTAAGIEKRLTPRPPSRMRAEAN